MTKREELERKIKILRFLIVGGMFTKELSSREVEELQKDLSKLTKELDQLERNTPRASCFNYSHK